MRLMIAAAMAAALLPGGAAFADCFSVLQGEDGLEYEPMQRYSVLQTSSRDGLMERPPVAEGAVGVMCSRRSIVPAEDDFEVTLHGLALMLHEGSGADVRISMLQLADGQFQIQMMTGEIDTRERDDLVERLDGFYDSYGELGLD